MAISPLTLADLPAAAALLATACPFDRAAEVAEEKLFGEAPGGELQQPRPLGLWEGDVLAAVASISGNTLRLLAVAPAYRGRGLGSALLAECEALARSGGALTLHLLGQPGNYLAPGIDERNVETLGWLGRRGYASGAPRTSLLVALRDNPRVSEQRREALTATLAARGYRLRRATLADAPALTAAIAADFGGTWPFEVARALRRPEPAVHLAERLGGAPPEAAGAAAEPSRICAFAAHDGNNAGLGWFGPAGTWPGHRGQRLGEALLLACLADIGQVAEQAEIAWIGPQAFYEKSCGIAGRRIFLPMQKALR